MKRPFLPQRRSVLPARISLLLIACVLAHPSAAGAGERLERVQGSVQRVSEERFGIVPDAAPGSRYAPDHLPDQFRVDGLRVIFSGVVGEVPPNARLWGTPLELTEIRRLDEK